MSVYRSERERRVYDVIGMVLVAGCGIGTILLPLLIGYWLGLGGDV